MRRARPSSEAAGGLTVRRLLGLVLCLALGWLPALADPGALRAAAALEEIASTPRAWFAPEHGLLLYARAPLAILSASLLFLSPGLLLALLLGAGAGLARWLLYGLGASLLVLSPAVSVAQACAAEPADPIHGRVFGLLVAGISLALAALLFIRLARGARIAWLPARRAALAQLAPTIAVLWVALAALAPKLHWEAFNGDGAHAFESVRLLLRQPLPFWSEAAGDIAAFPGVSTALFCYPGSWFLRLFGEIEGAARAPVALVLAGVFAGAAAFAEHGRAPLGALRSWLLWLALAVYLLVMAFSASYDPYSADLALPATQDTLLVACLLGLLVAFLGGERGWIAAFTLLVFLSLPSGVLLIGLWLLAVLALARPLPRRALAWTAASLAVCMALGAALPGILGALGLPRPGGEYESIVNRFLFLQFTDVRRLLYLAVPCGFLPAVALLRWRALDPWARALAAATLAYFAFFYFQAYVSLHHFVPCMVLSLAVHARAAEPEVGMAWKRRALFAAGIALGGWIAWPDSAFLSLHAKEIGRTLAVRAGDYARSDPGPFRASSLLKQLFPPGTSRAVPEQGYGGSPLAWNRYARHGAPAEGLNYALQPRAEPAPTGMRAVADDGEFALYVRSDEVWNAHRSALLESPAGSRLLAIDRGLLFYGSAPRQRRLFILNVRSILRRMGL